MKTKLLRKIRKKYSWKITDNQIVLLNNQNHTAKSFRDIYRTMTYLIEEFYGIYSSINYHQKHNTRQILFSERKLYKENQKKDYTFTEIK